MQLNICGGAVWRGRPLEEWLPFVASMLNDFFLPDADTEAAMTLIEQQWQAIIAEGVAAEIWRRGTDSYCGMNWHSVWIRNVLASASGEFTSIFVR